MTETFEFHSLVPDPHGEGWVCSARPSCDWLLIDVSDEEIAQSIWSDWHTHGEEGHEA